MPASNTTPWALFGLGLFVLLGSNASLMLSGWVDEFSKRPPVTGIFVLDLLTAFFPAVYETPSARIIMDVMSGFAVAASTAVVYEGSRRRGPGPNRFNQNILAAFWWVAQFVAIGFATPVYFAMLLNKPVKDSEYVHVGKFRVFAVLLGIIGTGAITPMLEDSIMKKNPDVSLMIAWLLFPVVVISLATAVDRSTSARRVFPGFLQLIPYLSAFAAGAVGHFRTVKVIADGQFSAQDILSNAPCVFLIFDLIGVVVGSYVWIQADKRISAFSYWWVALLFGPGAHFALLCAVRDRKVEDRIPNVSSASVKQE